MSSSIDSAEPQCTTCHKPQSKLPNPLKHCAKCKSERYCSRDCQKADWKRHKVSCSTQASTASNSTTSSGSSNASKGRCHIDKPFTAINNGTFLHNRPEHDVFKLLIDTYRMRVEDQYKFSGEVEEGSLYSGANAQSALAGFRRFLIKTRKLDEKRQVKLLPEWWSDEKQSMCVAFALEDEWSNVGFAVEKSDVQEHYGDQLMPMKLRMLGERIDGTMPTGQSGEQMLKVQVMLEAGNGMASTHLSL